MRKTFVLLPFAASVAIILFAQTPSQRQTISGRVLDPTDKQIENVRVQAYRQSQLLGETRSNAVGEYSITFQSGAPVDTVRYDHTDWFSGTVEHVSGTNDQRVFKTLYKRGAPLSYFQIQETVFAFERIQDIDRARTPVQPLQVNFGEFRYRAAFEELDIIIDKLDVSEDVRNELKRRMAEIKKKYGIGAPAPLR